MRVMGIDLGTKTIGVAISDELGLTAQPVCTLKRVGLNSDLIELSSLIKEYGVDEIVVGLPLRLNGTASRMSEAVLRFVQKLKAYTGLGVVTWDERLSTVAVTRILKDADVSRKKRKKVVDKLAASYILQGYLDSIGRTGR